MTEDAIHPALLKVVQALARLQAERDYRESLDAQPVLNRWRAAMQFDLHDEAHNERLNKMVAEMYDLMPEAIHLTAAQRITFLALAAEILGPRVSDRRILERAVEIGRGCEAATDASRRC